MRITKDIVGETIERDLRSYYRLKNKGAYKGRLTPFQGIDNRINDTQDMLNKAAERSAGRKADF